ncbi:CAP domain-containing protein [Candidatus Poribacteria bacterium]|nr:CAP domain-containing protein [Candidatus Poribacteria bacterium]
MKFRLVTFLFLAVIFTIFSCKDIFDSPASEETKPSNAKQPYLPNSNFNVATAEARLFNLVNEQRVQHGKLLLQLRQDLVLVARKHSEDMRDRNFFAHVNPDGKDVSGRAKAAGIVYDAIGENLAWSSIPATQQIDPLQDTVIGWMNSPGHRANILDNLGYTHTGIGIAIKDSIEEAGAQKIGIRAYYFTQVFLKPKN